MEYPFRILLPAIFLLALSACGTFPKNPPLKHYDQAKGYRFDNLSKGAKNTDSLFVILTFFGGGTRAASFSYGVMEALRDIEIEWKGQKKRLLDEVDIISSVSGGSFPAAYYGLHGDGLFSGAFEREFLKKNIEKELFNRAISPANWFKLAGSSFGRSDLAADYYNEKIVEGATYADLISKGTRPLLMVNATDMSAGEQFPFIQDQFDLICSDLSSLPLARAVASSSAFPGLLTPLTYQNYAGGCSYQQPKWVELAEKNDRRSAPERANLAERMKSYYQPQPWATRKDFIHLVDGGVSDNIGLRGILFALQSGDSPYSIQTLINRKEIEKLLIIVVNSATEREAKRDSSKSVPDLVDVLTTAAMIPLDRYSFDTVDRGRDIAKKYNQSARTRKDCEKLMQEVCPKATLPGGDLYPVDVYLSHITFDYIEDPKTRFEYRNLPTTFELPGDTVDALRKMGGIILKQDPDFKRFMGNLNCCAPPR